MALCCLFPALLQVLFLDALLVGVGFDVDAPARIPHQLPVAHEAPVVGCHDPRFGHAITPRQTVQHHYNRQSAAVTLLLLLGLRQVQLGLALVADFYADILP